MSLDKYPEKLTKGRNSLEGSFVFTLWRKPELFGDYEIDEDTLKTEDGDFYYKFGKEMYRKGLKSFDNISIYTFLENKPTLRKKYEKKGGYATVEELKELVDINNADSYYDEIIKMNILLSLHDKGFNVVSNFDKFQNMSSQDVYDYFDYILNNVTLNKQNNVNIEDLSSGYEKYIDEWDSGADVGFPVATPSLNYMLAGVHKENLMLHLAGIGQGKTTTAIFLYVIPAIKNGENVCIIANEQSISSFRQMILATVMFNEINYKKMNRQKIIIGKYNNEQKEKLKEAAEWIKNQKGKIIFAEMENYSISSVKKVIKKYSKIGIGLFLFDTLKPQSDASDRSWGEFSEVAKELFILSKHEQVAIVATAQLSPESTFRKYLDLSCIGKSKAIAETASTVVMFRTLSDEEKDEIRPYSFDRVKKEKVFHDLDVEKDYIMLFVAKNRYGQINPQIIFERNMNFNYLREVGYYNCPLDEFRKK